MPADRQQSRDTDPRVGDADESEPTKSARLVLAFGILFGVGTAVSTVFLEPRQVMLASDVYLTAGDAFLAGGDFYGVSPPDRPGYFYLYPPITVLLFVPHALLGTAGAAFGLQTAVNVACSGGIAVLLWRALSRRGSQLTGLDGGLLVGFALFSSYSAITVLNGQVTLWLAFAFAVGFDALDRNRETRAGAAFAGAALFKVFPAGIGLWLLRRRAWKAVVTAVIVGVGGLLAGLLVAGPDTTATYLTEVLTGRYDGFEGAPPPTETRGGAQRQIAAIFGLGPPFLTPLAFAILAPPVALLYRRTDTDERQQAAILGTITATLLFFPLQRLYLPLLLFPLVVLLYRLSPGRPRTLLVAGTLVSFVRTGYEPVVFTTETLGLSGSVGTAIEGAAELFFRVILPPTLGLWLLLVACLLVHYESVSRRHPVTG